MSIDWKQHQTNQLDKVQIWLFSQALIRFSCNSFLPWASLATWSACWCCFSQISKFPLPLLQHVNLINLVDDSDRRHMLLATMNVWMTHASSQSLQVILITLLVVGCFSWSAVCRWEPRQVTHTVHHPRSVSSIRIFEEQLAPCFFPALARPVVFEMNCPGCELGIPF